MSKSFAERFASIEHVERVLVENVEARVVAKDLLVIASICRGIPLETAVAKISMFAFVLTSIITALVAIGAAPKPIGGIAAFWLITAIAARLFVRARRREHGRFIIDFESSTLAGETVDGELFEMKLDEVRLSSAVDEALPLWICIEGAGRRVRFARTSEEDATKVLYFFRKYGVPIHDTRAGGSSSIKG